MSVVEHYCVIEDGFISGICHKDKTNILQLRDILYNNLANNSIEACSNGTNELLLSSYLMDFTKLRICSECFEDYLGIDIDITKNLMDIYHEVHAFCKSINIDYKTLNKAINLYKKNKDFIKLNMTLLEFVTKATKELNNIKELKTSVNLKNIFSQEIW